MASRYEVEVTIDSARDLKNVNWRNGSLKAYAVVWIDPAAKCSTKADVDGDANPVWDQKLVVPLGPAPIDEAVLSIDVVHAAGASDDEVKPLIGSARLPLREIVDEAGIGSKVSRTLKLKRPSGRPQGKLDFQVKVAAKDPPPRYYDPYAVPYGVPPPSSRDATPPYGGAYGQPYGGGGYGQPYGVAPPPSGYPYGAPVPPQPAAGYGYGAPAPPQPAAGYGYGGPSQVEGYAYGAAPPAAAYGEGKKKSKFGMGTGLAVGAAAGVLGGLALAEGVDYVEDKIADDVEERVEDDLGYDDF